MASLHSKLTLHIPNSLETHPLGFLVIGASLSEPHTSVDLARAPAPYEKILPRS